jgi:hypothetical protein
MYSPALVLGQACQSILLTIADRCSVVCHLAQWHTWHGTHCSTYCGGRVAGRLAGAEVPSGNEVPWRGPTSAARRGEATAAGAPVHGTRVSPSAGDHRESALGYLWTHPSYAKLGRPHLEASSSPHPARLLRSRTISAAYAFSLEAPGSAKTPPAWQPRPMPGVRRGAGEGRGLLPGDEVNFQTSYVRPCLFPPSVYDGLMNVHVTLSLPPDKLRDFDVWWKAEGFTSRSSAVAYLISRAAKL